MVRSLERWGDCGGSRLLCCVSAWSLVVPPWPGLTSGAPTEWLYRAAFKLGEHLPWRRLQPPKEGETIYTRLPSNASSGMTFSLSSSNLSHLSPIANLILLSKQNHFHVSLGNPENTHTSALIWC